ncbi:Histone-lysine N-methyltransferase [Lachnellula occidentalis]|uniref:Histone-lysine N-methyltransferase n=1 Tax=Lachnellula occidentalis TaxID=215460 RepID=A0A8H8RUH6_9HELO|nr:Histone-lysine N-methyltransferase [Lachnellula occidentalis]
MPVDIDLTQDSDDESSRPPRSAAPGLSYIDLTEDGDDEPVLPPFSRTHNDQSRAAIPPTVKPNPTGSASPALSKNSLAPRDPAPPRGRARNEQNLFRQSGEASSSRPSSVENAKSMPPKPTAFANTSDPSSNQSPFHPYGSPLDIQQTHPGTRELTPPKAGNDVLLPREQAANVAGPTLCSPPKDKRAASISSPDPASRASSNLAKKESSSSKPVTAAAPARPSPTIKVAPPTHKLASSSNPVETSRPSRHPSKDHVLPDSYTSSSENEDPSFSDPEDPPIEPILPENDIKPMLVTPSKRSSRKSLRPHRSSIPDSIGSPSPNFARLRNTQYTRRDPRERDESPREVMARRNLPKEKIGEGLNPPNTPTIQSLEESLRSFEQDMNDMHALSVKHLLRDAREAEGAREQLFVDAVSPFGSLKGIQLEPKTPLPKEAYVQQLDSYIVKGKSSNNNSKLTKSRSIIVAKTFKSNISRVPRFASHTFVRRNILSADDEKLRFVPYLGDVDTSHNNKRRLEKDLAEAYTAERSESSRVSENISNLGAHLEYWLEDLDIGCTKQDLEHYILRQEDVDEAVLGKKARKTLLASYATPLTTENLKMANKFSQAFETVFGLSLGKVLWPADRLKEMMEAAKANSGRKSLDKIATSLETHLETYTALSCLICGAIECQTHGAYHKDSDDEEGQAFKKQISMPPKELIRIYKEHLANNPKRYDIADTYGDPCGKNCHLTMDSYPTYEEFTQKSIEDLSNMLFGWEEKISRSCDISIGMGLPCWQVFFEIEKIELEHEFRTPEDRPAGRVKRPIWYDNKRKELKAGFEDMTNAHLHQERSQINPCAHSGRPCDAECPCAKADILCESMCGCHDDCPRKFTGCSCSLYGRPCSTDSCICIQMNRECGPQCTKCGAVERLDPRNKYNDALFTIGCQNIALSRGVPKSLIMGESQLEGTGFGLYAAEPIRRGEFISEYGGEIISTDEAERRGIIYDRKYLSFLFDLNGDWVIDAARLGNKTRFINHADNDKDGLNCEAKILFVSGEHRIKFLALRDIREGEELLFNYGKKFADKHGLNKKLPKIKEGAKKGVVIDDALDALDGVDSRRKGTNVKGNMTGMNRGRGRGRGRGRARKSAPTREMVKKLEAEPEPEEEEEDEEMPDIHVDVDDDEDEYEEDEDEPRNFRPRRTKTKPLRYTR